MVNQQRLIVTWYNGIPLSITWQNCGWIMTNTRETTQTIEKDTQIQTNPDADRRVTGG